MPISGTGREPVAGRIIRTVEIPARHGAAVEVTRGQVVRVIDVDGAQVGDLVCFNRQDLGEAYSPQNTVLFNRTIYPKVGAVLVSNRGRVMMRMIADTVGVHDLICGSCSDEYYRNRLDHHEPHRSCRSNLAEAMSPWGVALNAIPFSFNVFMRWPVQADGAVVPMAAPSRAGDYADFPRRWTWSSPTPLAPPTSPRPTPTTRPRCGSWSMSRRADARASASSPPSPGQHRPGAPLSSVTSQTAR